MIKCESNADCLDSLNLRNLHRKSFAAWAARLRACSDCSWGMRIQQHLDSLVVPPPPPDLGIRTRLLVGRIGTEPGEMSRVTVAAPAGPARLSELRGQLKLAIERYALEPDAFGQRRVERSLRCLIRILERNPDIRVSLGEMSKLLHADPSYCCKAFQRIAGTSFNEWERSRRISYAIWELGSSSVSISRVAANSGFSISTFTRNFRRVVGMTPSEFRRAGKAVGADAVKTGGL